MKQLQLTAEKGEYDVTDFAQHYAAYLEERAGQEDFSDIAWILLVTVGGFLFLLGVGMIFTGPSGVKVSPSGPSLLQFIQLIPGPIATLGAFLVALAGWLREANEGVLTPEAYLKKSWFLLLPDGTQCDERLSIAWLENERFAIEITAEAVADTAA